MDYGIADTPSKLAEGSPVNSSGSEASRTRVVWTIMVGQWIHPQTRGQQMEDYCSAVVRNIENDYRRSVL